MKGIQKRKRKLNVLAIMACLILGLGTVFVTPYNGMSKVYADEGDDVTNMDPNGVIGRSSDVGISLTDSVIGKAGEGLALSFTIKSADVDKIKIKNVYPVVDSDFPFETSKDAYKVESAGGDAARQASMSLTYNMVARTDLETGYHSVRYIVEYTRDKDGTAQDYYIVKTINIYFHGIEKEQTTETPVEETTQDTGTGAAAGGSGGSGNLATPKLIITGYETSPKKVMAGQTFTLTIHVQNTSKRTAVKNAKFLIGNEAGSILPTSGSSSIYVESIPAGNSGDLTIEMKTASDLQQKSYIVAVKGDFEDNQNNSYTYSENLYLPIYQEVKLKVTDATVTPDTIGIDETGTVMFTINNQGKAGVYNVNVSTKSDAVESEETYVGNVAAAGSAYASIDVTGVADNSDSGMITVVVSYEDADGKVNTMEEEIPCYVGEDVGGDYSEDMDMEEQEESGSGIGKIILIIFILLVVIAVIVTVVVIINVKKKKQKALLDDLEDEDLEDENI